MTKGTQVGRSENSAKKSATGYISKEVFGQRIYEFGHSSGTKPKIGQKSPKGYISKGFFHQIRFFSARGYMTKDTQSGAKRKIDQRVHQQGVFRPEGTSIRAPYGDRARSVRGRRGPRVSFLSSFQERE